MIILETVANPTLRLTSIQNVRQAGKVPVLVDSTFATPILQSPLELGATMVMHSATKYIGGHGDAMGGIVAGAADWMKDVRAIRAATGAVLHPQAAYTLHRGLQTLGLASELHKPTQPNWHSNCATIHSSSRFTFLDFAIVTLNAWLAKNFEALVPCWDLQSEAASPQLQLS